MKIIIDATNIKAGGGLTHLKRLLEERKLNLNTVEIVGGAWLDDISDSAHYTKRKYLKAFYSLVTQELFKKFALPEILKQGDIAFIPGGTFSSKNIPYVTMSQNMLVFEETERNRFPMSSTRFRYQLLERLQLRSFKNAKGIIYISHYAKNLIENKYPELKNKPSITIYHGISEDFRQEPKLQICIDRYKKNQPFKILYVSIVNYYKHQWNVIEAVKKIRNEGFMIELELIGPMYHPVKGKFNESLKGTEEFVFYKGKVPYDQIAKTYKNANLFVFASTCENMPNILVEAMSAGLPILSSDFGPMPEILKDAGEYMDPTDVESIYVNLKCLLLDPERRDVLARKAYTYSKDFSWAKTADETFRFIDEIANEIQ